jgi:hypothetical protein
MLKRRRHWTIYKSKRKRQHAPKHNQHYYEISDKQNSRFSYIGVSVPHRVKNASRYSLIQLSQYPKASQYTYDIPPRESIVYDHGAEMSNNVQYYSPPQAFFSLETAS